jgi:hypothetical protein
LNAGFRCPVTPTSGAGDVRPVSASDVEALCRSVIGWVHLALSDRPERAEAVSGRLECELQSHLARFGFGYGRLPGAA